MATRAQAPLNHSSRRVSAHKTAPASSGPIPSDLIHLRLVDRRLAYKNMRTALIAGAISLIVFALAWVVGLIY